MSNPTDIHSELTDDSEIHVPKGFTSAPPNTLPTKNSQGNLEWVPTNSLTGTQGPPGPSIREVEVQDTLNPIELNNLDETDGSQLMAIKFRTGQKNSSNLYQWDPLIAPTENPPYVMFGKNNSGQWTLVSGTIPDWILNGAASTTIIQGGVLTINGTDPQTVDISEARIVFVDNYSVPTENQFYIRTIPAKIGVTVLNLLTTDYTVFAYDKDGNVYKTNANLTPGQRRELCRIGLAYHPDDAGVPQPQIDSVGQLPQNNYGVGSTLLDLFSVLGPQNFTGNIYSANGANLKINKSSGETFAIGSNFSIDKKNPNYKTDASASALLFSYNYRSSPTVWDTLKDQTDINPNQMDSGNGLTSVGVGKYTIQRIFYNSYADVTRILFGQTEYADFDTALSNLNSPYELPPNFSSTGYVYRSALIIKQGTTNLTAAITANEARFVAIDPRFQGSSQGSSSIATLQSAYDASTDGKIVVKNSKGPFKVEAENNTTNDLLNILNELGGVVASISRSGAITGLNATKTVQGLMSPADKTQSDQLKIGWIQYTNAGVLAPNGTNVVLDLDSNQNSYLNGLFDKPTNSEFRALFAGFVKISYHATFTASANNNNFEVKVRKNGVDVINSPTSDGGSSNGAEASVSGELIVPCAILDVFTLVVTNVAGGAQTAQANWINMLLEAKRVD